MAVSPSPGQREYVHDHMERSTNGSSFRKEPGHFSLGDWMQMPIMLIALVGLAGNSTVLWLLAFSIQRNSFSVYLLNLAGADALFLCCSFLSSIHEVVRYLRDTSIHVLLQYVAYMFYTVGLSLLAAISTERCLSVLFPLWYRCHRPKRTTAAVCTLLWALGGLLEVAHFVVCYPDTGLMKYTCLEYLLTEFAWFILLTCVLCASSLTLLLRVQCSSQRRQPPRIYLLVLLTVLVFLLCGLPMETEEFLRCFDIDFLPGWLRQLLACVNSSANPFIYFFLGRLRHKQKEPLRVILQRALGDKQDSGGGTGAPSNTNTREMSF